MKSSNAKQRSLRQAGRISRNSFLMVILAVGLCFVPLLSCGVASAAGKEVISDKEPALKSPGEDVTPLDESFQEEYLPPGFFPSLKEKIKDMSPFIRDTKLDLNLRTFYFTRDKFDSSKSEAWALGGSLTYRSGWLFDRFGMGAAFYTSQPLYAPSDRDGTLLLETGQEAYNVLGQIYGRVKLLEGNYINLFRYEYNTPYMNKNDSRMSPNTFEGYTLTGATSGDGGIPKFTYGAGYIDKIKPRNSDTFMSMSEAAGADEKRGVFTGGLNIAFPAFSIGAIDYYSDDIINIGYAEAKYTASLTKEVKLLVSAQYTDQRSVGDDLLKGYSFETNQFGIKTDLSAGGAVFTLAYTLAGTGDNLQSPWSSYPGYTSVQVQDFNRAGENAFMVKGAYDFTNLGLTGISVYSLWVHGWNAVNPSTNASIYNQDEYDVDLQWRPEISFMKGVWFRMRYGHLDQNGAANSSTMDDFRVIVNYDLPLL